MAMRHDGTAVRGEPSPLRQSKGAERVKWRPKRDLWQGNVTDDAAAFGELHSGHEIEVFVERSKHPQIRSVKDWMPGVVIAVDESQRRVAVNLTSDEGTLDIRCGFGFIRRAEDAPELCTTEELETVARHRVRGEASALVEYAGSLAGIAPRSHAVIALCRMGEVRRAHVLVWDRERPVSSIAVREAAQAWAVLGDVSSALRYLGMLRKPAAAQLLVEVLALALTGRIQAERQRLGMDFLRGVESNPAVAELVSAVKSAVPLLEEYVRPVRDQPPLVSRKGLTEAFNELLKSCGRAHAVPLAFHVLEWMEALAVPKDAFTYEAIGLNVVKRVGLLRRVWDLPTAPEETVPEIVFAGRSNVGKSSLVNMLLGRAAIAPTSSKPGKTRTMDFFDVNAGHPALPRFRLVDVPGLGFARASKEMRLRWVGLIGGYFVQRKTLKVVFHLLDGGLCEIMPADRDLWKLLAQARRTDYQLCIALTKADNSQPSYMERFARTVREALRAEGSELALHATIFACSAKSKLGKDTLWREIWGAVAPGPALDAPAAPGGAAPPRRPEEFAERGEPAPAAGRPEVLEAAA